MKQYCTSEEDIETLFTYFQAAINGEENKESLKRLFDLQCGVMRSHPYQSERDTVLDDVDKILNCRTELMEELFDELRDPAVAKHSLQQIEIIRSRVNDLRDMKAGEP